MEKLWNGEKVLLVEDDDLLREVVASMVEELGLSVTQAENGVVAKGFIDSNDFQLVISDIRMPGLSGIELLNYVKAKKPIKVVLMTGFDEALASREAHEHGAVGFLAKPFLPDELSETLKKALSNNQVHGQSDLDYEFTGIRIEEFITGKEILFDIFVRISKVKFIKIATTGESIEFERIKTYKERGLTHLYLRNEDFRKYLGFSSNVALKASKSDQLESAKKLNILTQASTEILKELYVHDICPEHFVVASELVTTTIGVVGTQNEVMKLFNLLRESPDHLYRHSLAVSLYSVLIAKAIGWSSPRTLIRLSLCGLLHDIGKKELPKELLTKSRIDLTPAELKELESHAQRGMNILIHIPNLPEEVAAVALQHHEDNRGLGYPQRLTKNKIIPIARLIGFVNTFCDMIFDSNGFSGISPVDALNRIKLTNEGRYDEEYFAALSRLLSGEIKGQ